MSFQAQSHYKTSHGYSQSIVQMHSWRTAENSAPYLLPYLKPDMKILDVGCGPGTITVDLALRIPQGHITGIDYAPEALEAACAFAKEKGADNVDFQPGDIFALPFPDHTFDVTHAHQVIQHVSDPVMALREMRRVTKPGGIVANREGDAQTFVFYPESEALTRWVAITKNLAHKNNCEPNAGRRLRAWARQAGFEPANIICGCGTWCFSTPEGRAYWAGSVISRFENSKLSATAIESGLATAEEIRETVEAFKAWQADEDGWFGVMHGEMIARV